MRYADLGGIDAIRQDIRELIENPLRHPEVSFHTSASHTGSASLSILSSTIILQCQPAVGLLPLSINIPSDVHLDVLLVTFKCAI